MSKFIDDGGWFNGKGPESVVLRSFSVYASLVNATTFWFFDKKENFRQVSSSMQYSEITVVPISKLKVNLPQCWSEESEHLVSKQFQQEWRWERKNAFFSSFTCSSADVLCAVNLPHASLKVFFHIYSWHLKHSRFHINTSFWNGFLCLFFYCHKTGQGLYNCLLVKDLCQEKRPQWRN